MPLILFNKPYNVLTQFTDKEGRKTLADFVAVSHVRPAGRLDYDSEGLVLLTDDGRLLQRIADPRFKLPKTYWVQVEGAPTAEAIERLRHGVLLNDGLTRPAQARVIPEPPLWPRVPPIRFRKHVPTAWIELTIIEGRNRQVRRMTAAVGFPTLRLVRVAVGPYRLDGLQPGEWREATPPMDGPMPRTQGRAGAARRLVESRHDLETERGSGGDRRARRKVSAGRGAGRRRPRAQPTRRPSR